MAAATLPAIRRNLDDVRGRVEAARRRSPRAAGRVELVVVTKAAPASVLPLLAACGVVDVGENRVQAAEARRAGAPPGLCWHGIGHLQRNKAARALAVFDVFHALDSPRLADRLAALRDPAAPPWPVYLQVNAAADPAKGGVAPDEALEFVKRTLRHPTLDVRGLMTMAPLGEGAEDRGEGAARAAFATLRGLRDEIVGAGLGDPPPTGLSMGMTDDFEWAVEEGATVVRVGSAIFRGLLDDTETASEDAAREGRPR
jgi:PLP dependent protein